MWRLLLLLAGDSGKQTSGFFDQNVSESTRPWSNLNEPTGDATAMFASGWRTTWRFEDKWRRRRKKCFEVGVREGKTRETETIRRDIQNSRKQCKNEEDWGREKERVRMELRQVMSLTPRLDPAPQRAKISFNRLRQREEMGHCGGTVGDQRSNRIATKQTHWQAEQGRWRYLSQTTILNYII